MYQVRYADSDYFRCAQEFIGLAETLNVHPVSLAIAWVMAHPAVTAPIIGARSVEQLQPALRSVDVEMTSDLYTRISGLFPAPPPATDRNEETSRHHYGNQLKRR